MRYSLGVVMLLEAFDVTNNGRHFWFLPRIRNLVKNTRNGIFFCALHEKKNKNKQISTLYDLSYKKTERYGIYRYISTWSYENRVSKYFVIFRNFPCLWAWHMFTVLVAYVVFFFLACFVARDSCRSGCRLNYYLTPPDFFPYPQFFL